MRRTDINETTGAIEELEQIEDYSVTFVRVLESFIFKNLGSLEDGLKPYQDKRRRQYSVSFGIIDILAQDKNGNFVVLELKAGKVTDSVLAQILAYMEDVKMR